MAIPVKPMQQVPLVVVAATRCLVGIVPMVELGGIPVLQA